ncbi:TlpA disulfide reductase family protein [uncultured Clostridium sp.]|uniref:TlpA family protein disulfide reductase n=1 Tax=uncultured Clostridium sp. TaxID=59620 RepID=UPI0025FCA22C|nr:TlpA disulfide reductase family protein [uncultured Clostridium sp.]
MKKNRLKRFITLSLAAIAVISLTGCSGLNTNKGDSKTERISNIATSDVFKKMETEDINGNKVDSSIFAENKLTVVNLWNTGCTPCVTEIPELDKLNKYYSDKGVSIKGLIMESGAGLTEEERKEVNEILSKAGAEYQQLTMSENMTSEKIFKDIEAFPTTYFVDKDGNIVNMIEGSSDFEGWKTRINEELSKVEG